MITTAGCLPGGSPEQTDGLRVGPAKRAKTTNGSTKLAALPIKRLLSASELAEFYGVSVRTIWRLVASRRIPQPDMRVGRLPRWKQESITQ
jgi:predicted DNA-binding transcriptional regulator AlpA